MKALLGVDGSDGSLAAASLAGRLLSAEHDQIAIYYSPPAIEIGAGKQLPGDISQRVHNALTGAVFEKACQRLPETWRDKVETIVGEQHPRHGLLAAAEQWRAELIVVGERSARRTRWIPIGSVALNVARSASVPVLVAREATAPEATADAPFRVLLADDGSEASRQAGQQLQKFHWPPTTEGYVIGVVGSLFVGEMPDWLQDTVRDVDSQAIAQAFAEEHQRERKTRADQLVGLAEHLPELFRHREPIVVEGHPVEQILNTVADRAIDLVVVGAHGTSAWRRLLLGSTSESVLTSAPCSVLLTHSHPHP